MLKPTTKNMETLLKMLVLLNAFDYAATYVGVQMGYVVEMNPLLVEAVENIYVFTGIKIFLVNALVLLLYYVFEKSHKARKGLVYPLVAGCNLVYGGIFLLHLHIIGTTIHQLMPLGS